MRIGTTVKSPAGTLEVSVLIDGAAQPLYRRPGDGKAFVAGVPGVAYTLQARNLTTGRLEILSAVDGRSTLKDEPADVHASQGMVVHGGQTWIVTGWRLNDSETREFIFTDPGASIAAQATGSVANVGVIGFAAYAERGHSVPLAAASPYPFPDPFLGGVAYRSAGGASYASNAPVAAAASAGVTMDSAAEPTLGTGMGELQQDHVGRTSFTRVYGEPDTLVIGYDTEAVLRERGILGPPEPKAFPGAGTGYEKYATTP